MLTMFSDLRVWVALFLAVGVMWANSGDAGHEVVQPNGEVGIFQHPRGDCGDNFFKVFTTPNGDECIVRVNSAETVEREMQKVDPTIFDESMDYVSPERWYAVLQSALKRLGW